MMEKDFSESTEFATVECSLLARAARGCGVVVMMRLPGGQKRLVVGSNPNTPTQIYYQNFRVWLLSLIAIVCLAFQGFLLAHSVMPFSLQSGEYVSAVPALNLDRQGPRL